MALPRFQGRHGPGRQASTDSRSAITSPSTLTSVCTTVWVFVACARSIPNDSFTSQNPAWLT